MENQEHAQTGVREKFAEPRGWALNWVLAPMPPAAPEPVPGADSGGQEKFAEPRGWALAWDGFALSGTEG